MYPITVLLVLFSREQIFFFFLWFFCSIITFSRFLLMNPCAHRACRQQRRLLYYTRYLCICMCAWADESVYIWCLFHFWCLTVEERARQCVNMRFHITSSVFVLWFSSDVCFVWRYTEAQRFFYIFVSFFVRFCVWIFIVKILKDEE